MRHVIAEIAAALKRHGVLVCVTTAVLLMYVPLYSWEQYAERGEGECTVMQARLDRMLMERDARRLREWNASVARKWALINGRPRAMQESEARIAAMVKRARKDEK